MTSTCAPIWASYSSFDARGLQAKKRQRPFMEPTTRRSPRGAKATAVTISWMLALSTMRCSGMPHRCTCKARAWSVSCYTPLTAYTCMHSKSGGAKATAVTIAWMLALSTMRCSEMPHRCTFSSNLGLHAATATALGP